MGARLLQNYRRFRSARAATAVIVSIALVLASLAALAWLSPPARLSADRSPPLTIYCAASIRTALEPILQRYREEYGVRASLQLGPSGELESQIKLSGRGDLFLPAARDPFLSRLQQQGLVGQVLSIAEQRLVLAVAPTVDRRPETLAGLIEGGWRYGVCNVQAAAGQRAKEATAPIGLWERLDAGAAASMPTVTELAEAVRDGGRLDAGVVWDVTARQFGLTFFDVPELASARSEVSVGVLTCSADPAAAERLARYLAAADRGQLEFLKRQFSPLPTQHWETASPIE